MTSSEGWTYDGEWSDGLRNGNGKYTYADGSTYEGAWKNNGVENILIACFDGLTGFPEAISAVYQKTEVQQCIYIRSVTAQSMFNTRH